MQSMPPNIAQLYTKLAELRRRVTFGVLTHRYQINPCLSERELRDVESQYRITLPEDYRDFLRFIGNGGAGPDYGIYPLERSLMSSVDDSRLLREPFPHTAAWNVTPEDLGIDPDDYGAFDEAYFDDVYSQGTLRIGTEGCGCDTLLVIAGSERGHVWCDARASDAGIYPRTALDRPNERLTFFSWYDGWLDQVLAKAAPLMK